MHSRGAELRKFVAPEVVFALAAYNWPDSMDATSAAAKR